MVEVRRLAPNIGAEIVGLNLASLDEEAKRAVYHAFLDHIVVVIRNQNLGIAEFLGFGRAFGELKPHMVKRSHHPEHPELMVMDNRVVDIRTAAPAGNEQAPAAKPILVKRGAVWHSDLMYEQTSAKATLLHGLAVPSAGGDTLFANTYASYERLPDRLKQRLEGLRATYIYGGRLKRQLEMLEEADRNRAPAVHSLVRVHPETGRKVLFFNDGQILEVLGLAKAESDALIAELKVHTEVPDYRHEWQRGDVVIWDNRCSIHCATGDYPPGERRTIWRTTIMEEGWQRQRTAS
jgi:taurine dioxygenase